MNESTTTTKRELWTRGRYGCAACLQIRICRDGYILASAEEDKITETQMARTLQLEYGHQFCTYRAGGYVYAEGGPR